MADACPTAHSLAEAYLFLMATPCPACGKGPLRGEVTAAPPGRAAQPHPAGRNTVSLNAECGACHAHSPWTFEVPGTAVSGTPPVINATDEPSRILDVAQWITLFRMISARAAEQADRQIARRLLIEAGQCLEEALKFYEPGNDLPPPTAFFHPGSRERLRTNPEQFSRQRLLGLRAKLPTESRLRPKP
jgi:hypothetical protein